MRCLLVSAVLLGLGLGCGEPLDRRDGALVVALEGAPARVDRLTLELVAGGRTFHLERDRPADDRVADFSAVPIGPAELTVRLYAGEALVAERVGMPIAIAEGRTVEVSPFSGAPELRLEARGAGRHARWAGPILVDVEDRTSAPASEIELTVEVDGVRVDAPAPAGLGWILQIDPARAGDLLPRTLEIRVEACFSTLPRACRAEVDAVEVHREQWQATLTDRPAGPPLVIADRGWLVVGDEAGALHVFDAQTGVDVQPSLQIGEGLVGGVARVGDVLAVSDRAGLVHGLALEADRLAPLWQASLSAPRPSPVVGDGARFVVADQARILALAPEGGATTEIGRASAPVAAAPLADAAGVVVADLQGGVRAFDAAGALRFEVDLEAPIYAPVVATPTGYLAATSAGQLFGLSAAGDLLAAPLELGAPVVFAPLRVDGVWAVATARSLKWVEGPEITEVPLGERVIGAPAPWPGGGVVVGLRNGRVVVVRRGQGARTLAKLEGVALAPTALDAPARAALGTSLGELFVLRAEEDF